VFFGTVSAMAEAITAGEKTVTAIYDYSNFANAGTFTSVKDLVNNTETRIYANMRVTGYYGTGGFITQSKSTLNGNGVTVKNEDVINQQTQTFSETGQILSAYSLGPTGEKYAADINYQANGDYSIGWKGVFCDANGKTISGSEGQLKSVEHYAADGKILSTDNYSWDTSASKPKLDGKTIYNYNASGDALVNVTTMALKEGTSDTWVKASVTSYEAGRAMYTTTFNHGADGVDTQYVSAKYSYTGSKLDHVDSYVLEGGKTILDKTQTYDEHGRASEVWQYNRDNTAQKRLVSKTIYNDSTSSASSSVTYKDENGNVKTQSVSVVAGGVLKSESYTYADTDANKFSTAKSKTSVTLYWNGNNNLPWGTVDQYTAASSTCKATTSTCK
jgi:hypothetical protein